MRRCQFKNALAVIGNDDMRRRKQPTARFAPESLKGALNIADLMYRNRRHFDSKGLSGRFNKP